MKLCVEEIDREIVKCIEDVLFTNSPSHVHDLKHIKHLLTQFELYIQYIDSIDRCLENKNRIIRIQNIVEQLEEIVEPKKDCRILLSEHQNQLRTDYLPEHTTDSLFALNKAFEH